MSFVFASLRKETRSEEKAASAESLLFDGEVLASPRERRFNISTIILSITTAVFGLLSLYLLLNRHAACAVTNSQKSFADGYETEWGQDLAFKHRRLLTRS